MDDNAAIFLFVTGAGACVQTPAIIRALVTQQRTVYTVLTPNVAQVTAPAPLMDIPGNHWIHAYQQTPLERYPFGTLFVAPCTFNTFNKIALGLADNLATAMIADGLGIVQRQMEAYNRHDVDEFCSYFAPDAVTRLYENSVHLLFAAAPADHSARVHPIFDTAG